MSSVTSPPASSASPLKEGVCLLLTLPLSGLAIVTLGGAASAVQTGPTVTVTSKTAEIRKSAATALLMGSCSQPSGGHCSRQSLRCRRAFPCTSLGSLASRITRGPGAPAVAGATGHVVHRRSETAPPAPHRYALRSPVRPGGGSAPARAFFRRCAR